MDWVIVRIGDEGETYEQEVTSGFCFENDGRLTFSDNVSGKPHLILAPGTYLEVKRKEVDAEHGTAGP